MITVDLMVKRRSVLHVQEGRLGFGRESSMKMRVQLQANSTNFLTLFFRWELFKAEIAMAEVVSPPLTVLSTG